MSQCNTVFAMEAALLLQQTIGINKVIEHHFIGACGRFMHQLKSGADAVRVGVFNGIFVGNHHDFCGDAIGAGPAIYAHNI